MTDLKPHPEAEKKIKPFFQNILLSHREIIHSIYLTGSILTSDYDPKHSDINSVLVLNQMSFAAIESIAPLGKKYGKKGIAAPLVMTPEYIKQSLDVFPIEFLDIHLLHYTWMGEDIFKDIHIHPPDLRRQCERELKIRLIRLRQNYISSAGDQKTLAKAFMSAFSSYIPVFRGIIALYGKKAPLTSSEVLSGIEETTGIGVDPFKAVWKLKKDRSRPTIEQLNTFFEDCYATIEKLGNIINALEE